MPKIIPEVELSALPKIPSTELRLLWVNDWYDGPLEAVVEHAGERCLMVLYGAPPEVPSTHTLITAPPSSARPVDDLEGTGAPAPPDRSPTARDDEAYRWLLVRLTDEQWIDETSWHALYVEHVGDHWCFHGDSVLHPSAPRAEEDGQEFFNLRRARPALDLRGNVVLGWTGEMPAR